MPHLPLTPLRLIADSAAGRLQRFWRETDASMTIEAILILPVYLQFYVAAYAFFDAFRTATVNEKAAYTIADVISRRNGGVPVDTAYIDWLKDLYDYQLEGRGSSTWIRVSSITYDSTDAVYEIEWSEATDGHADLTDADLLVLAPRLPNMPGGDSVLLVETNSTFGVGLSGTRPLLFSALGNQNLSTFIFTRPRFAPRIDFSS